LENFVTQKKGPHFLAFFRKRNFRRKKKVRFLLRLWTFFFIWPIYMIFMVGKVNTYYFLDLEKFLQKKCKKGYYEHFGTLAILCPDLKNRSRYQNVHSTLFYHFFVNVFPNLKCNMYLLYPRNIIFLSDKIHQINQSWWIFTKVLLKNGQNSFSYF
jgi:hypothetical protein